MTQWLLSVLHSGACQELEKNKQIKEVFDCNVYRNVLIFHHYYRFIFLFFFYFPILKSGSVQRFKERVCFDYFA